MTASEELDGARGRRRDLSPGTVLAERYQVDGLLGRGGMGVVVRAHDRVLGVDVAIKLLREDLEADRRWAERLAREVKTARLIRHPNVCRVFDFQNAAGQAFIVMELATGTLADEFANAERVARPLEDRLADARAITAGLTAIHDAGIVHRDVSPRNILRLADGRLVLSDLGLAIDIGDAPATLDGGTVAYMAPELAAGGRASVASDIWALGIVIFEVVFGARPSWPEGAVVRGIDRPAGRLTKTEEALFALCRHCTAAAPAARPRAAGELLDRLDKGPRRRRLRSRPLVAVAAAMAIAGSVLGWKAMNDRRPSGRMTDGPLEPTGVPRDWTDVSRVLLTIPDRVTCMLPLPDEHTLRVVWGRPPVAEDVDIDTGVRHPSPLVPAAYAHGCPDVAPDGRTVIFQGYDGEGRPAIFESSHPDGSDAHFSVSAADPSFLSEPRWFADGRAFVFDADDRHIGVAERATGRTTILPTVVDPDDYSIFRFVKGTHVFWLRHAGEDTVTVQSMSWPALVLSAPLTVKKAGVSWEVTADGHTLYAPEAVGSALLEVDTVHHRATKVGVVRDGYLTLPRLIGSRLSFVSSIESSDVWVPDGEGQRQITHDGEIAQAARCANGELLVSREPRSGIAELGRLGSDGHFRRLRLGRMVAPACSKTTDEWWYTDRQGQRPVTYHCDGQGCAVIGSGYVVNALSPDESRIASLGVNNRGVYIQWLPSRGGPSHEVAPIETNCSPVWSSNDTLWISRRRGERILWREVNVDTGAETGRTRPAGSDCADGRPDPVFPPEPDLQVVRTVRSEVRCLPLTQVEASAPTLGAGAISGMSNPGGQGS